VVLISDQKDIDTVISYKVNWAKSEAILVGHWLQGAPNLNKLGFPKCTFLSKDGGQDLINAQSRVADFYMDHPVQIGRLLLVRF